MSDLFLGGLVETGDPGDRFHLPSDRLRRHGVVIGMTGSGKTGLSIGLLEELALAGVPVIALDPKGDLANLALVFPELQPEDFTPWVDESEAKQKGISRQELGAKMAGRWSEGLEGWGIEPARLQALKDKLSLRVFTPGSESGEPVDVLAALGSPGAEVLEDADAVRSLITGTVSSLLSLVAVKADPLRSPEHAVLGKIIEDAWRAGEPLDAERLLMQLVDPPFKKVGIFPVDKFWKPDDRMDLAMKLNAVIASSAFAPWSRGAPLDPAMLLEPGDKTRVNVFYMAHLDESQRMFFAGLLLERVLAWSRSLPGTSGLRALVYLDEAYGYLPPHPANPPTKRPLLTLMKQARAVGVGVLLATQNPVDLDYKALTNAGMWFLGRLSTKNDVDRVAEGLRAAAGGDDPSDQIASLQPRQFLVRDVKEPTPSLIRSRWAMSFLRGPVTRREIPKLPLDDKAPPTSRVLPALADTPAPVDDGTLPAPPAPPRGAEAFFLDPRAVFSARLEGAFDDAREPPREEGVLFRPALYCKLALRFDEEKAGYLRDEEVHRVWFPLDRGLDVTEARSVKLDDRDVLRDPPDGARFDSLPEDLDERTEFTAAKREVLDHVWRTEARGQWVCKPLKISGVDGEDRDAFEDRCRDAMEDDVDGKLEKIAARHEAKFDRLEDRIRKQEARIRDYDDKVKGARATEMLNGAEVLASFFFGRKRSLTSVASKRKTSASAANRAESAKDDLEALEEQLADLRLDLEDAQAKIAEEAEEALEAIEEREVRLEKSDIAVRDFGILWIPVTARL